MSLGHGWGSWVNVPHQRDTRLPRSLLLLQHTQRHQLIDFSQTCVKAFLALSILSLAPIPCQLGPRQNERSGFNAITAKDCLQGWSICSGMKGPVCAIPQLDYQATYNLIRYQIHKKSHLLAVYVISASHEGRLVIQRH